MEAWLSPHEYARMRRLLGLQPADRGGFTDFVRMALEEMERRRASEAGQYVRAIVPDMVARLGVQVFEQQATILMETARRQDRRTRDGMMRATELRREAGPYLDAAAWCSGITKQYDRLAEHTSPQSLDPTSPHTADRTSPHPATREDS